MNTAWHTLANKYFMQVLLFCFVLTGAYCLVYWNQYNEIPWTFINIVFQFVNIFRQTTLDKFFTQLNWVIGITLIFAATRLPEFSIILSIATPICIIYPKEVYKFIKQSVEAILMYNHIATGSYYLLHCM